MKKYILYAHDGSANHGCEALVRSTCKLLNQHKDNIVLVSTRPDEDIKYGIDEICNIKKKGCLKRIPRTDFWFWKAYFKLKFLKDYKFYDMISEALGADARRGDVALSIGGDTYCYGFADHLAQKHSMWKAAGLKTVYWGCSIEPELLNDKDIRDDVSKYDLITARETISYNALKSVNPNTILVADSAFLLEKTDVSLPDEFLKPGVVGINSSPLVEQSGESDGAVRKNYEKLIEKILEETEMNILLIPHVIWQAVDDREVLQSLYDKYSENKRILLLGDCDCRALKGYISKCRFFVGARTHATIAAYSEKIPTLVVGYSVKSKGIARDLFGSEKNYVIPAQEMNDEMDLYNSFEWLVSNEESIKSKLNSIIPSYSNRVYAGVEALMKL